MHDVIVVGAGAAGLWAAATAARRGLSVLLVEKTPRSGTKILASGGSRCNLTTTLPAAAAAQLFGPKAARFLRPAFDRLPPEAVRAHFEGLGVPTVEAPMEKIFPASQRAKDVRDALERDALAAGVTIVHNSPVSACVPAQDTAPASARWCLKVEGLETAKAHGIPGRGPEKTGDNQGMLFAQHVFLCTGGQSVPTSGTTGEGYEWLRQLGLEIQPPVPALVGLTSPDGWVHELSG
ncbi:MAG: FAD-dependent oxidoreductase, partial [Planctomycetes bacterium]|nr:FAD-dependent oxidoreductase [Planctomycetota bacterium]